MRINFQKNTIKVLKTVFEFAYHLTWNFRKKFKNNFETNDSLSMTGYY